MASRIDNWIRAGELVEQLEKDPDYARRREEREKERGQRVVEFKAAAEPIVEDLRQSGVNTLGIQASDLAASSNCKAAIPVLIRWLPKVSDTHVKEAIARSLTIKYACRIGAKPLITIFYGSKTIPMTVKLSAPEVLPSSV